MVYVFDANPNDTTFGNLLLTLAYPGSGGGAEFGAAVAGAGNDIAVGAPTADPSLPPTLGQVYLFDGTTGSLLATITNPVPGSFGFGTSVAGDGNDVVIGSPFAGDGVAYLYDTSGDRLATFLPPDSGGEFGASVASVGSNILIGSPQDNSGAGAAYLYGPSAR